MTAARTAEVAYRVVDSPIGTLLAAASPTGLVRLALPGEGLQAVLEKLANLLRARPVAAPQPLDAVARQLDEYFSGTRTSFELPLDLSLSQGFRRVVLTRLQSVPYGQTVSYGELAALCGNPKASRAVGGACATNPIPIVIPCHRVLRSDGGLGGYGGGLPLKQHLLALEQRAGR